jgi:hypothetical protein
MFMFMRSIALAGSREYATQQACPAAGAAFRHDLLSRLRLPVFEACEWSNIDGVQAQCTALMKVWGELFA